MRMQGATKRQILAVFKRVATPQPRERGPSGDAETLTTGCHGFIAGMGPDSFGIHTPVGGQRRGEIPGTNDIGKPWFFHSDNAGYTRASSGQTLYKSG